MKTVLKVRDIYKILNGFSLKYINLEVKEREIIFIYGSNGSGKTTLLEALSCISPPSKGEISIFGKQVFKDRLFGKRMREVNSDIGLLSQNQGLFDSLTVNETFDLFSYLYDKKIDWTIIDNCPHIQNDLDKRIKKLSEGKKKLTKFLLTTLNSPNLLFLDEPESNLDDETRSWIYDMIEDMKNEGSSFVITSTGRWEINQIVDKVIFLENGEIGRRTTDFNEGE